MMQALRAVRNDGKSFASESNRVASGNVKASGDGPIATAKRTGVEQVLGQEDTSKMVRKTLAREFGLQKIHFVPLKDGSVFEYGTPSSSVQKDAFMRELGATYAIHWVREGDAFVVDKDYTTEARKRALKQTRRDDKTFASESRNVRLSADGNGPVATAFKSGREQVISKDGIDKMVRADLARDFGIKQMHFIPLPDGSVLEYGTPSGEEMLFITLFGLLIQEILLVKNYASLQGSKTLAKLTFEMFGTIRMVAVTEGPANVSGCVDSARVCFMLGSLMGSLPMKCHALVDLKVLISL